jgi:hypothetical protein
MYQDIISLMPKNLGYSCPTAVQNTFGVIGTGTTRVDQYPLYGLDNYGETASIYTAANLNALAAGSKQIRGIGYYFRGFTVPYTFSNVEVWLAHTSNAEFPVGTTVGYSGMNITNLTKCDVASWTISVNNTFQFRIFNTSNFCYNGTDNLLVIMKNYDGAWASGYGGADAQTVVGFRTVYTLGQNAAYPPNGTAMTREQRVSNIRIYY